MALRLVTLLYFVYMTHALTVIPALPMDVTNIKSHVGQRRAVTFDDNLGEDRQRVKYVTIFNKKSTNDFIHVTQSVFSDDIREKLEIHIFPKSNRPYKDYYVTYDFSVLDVIVDSVLFGSLGVPLTGQPDTAWYDGITNVPDVMKL